MVKIFDFGNHRGSYIMHRLQNTEMTINASPRVVKALKGELMAIVELLKDNRMGEGNNKKYSNRSVR